MKLSKSQMNSKQRLNILCHLMGFEALRKIVKLSGSSLGQYLAHDCSVVIPDSKLLLAEAEYKLSQSDKLSKAGE